MEKRDYIKKLFPQLEEELITILEKEAMVKEVKAGDVLLDKGQFIRSAMLVADGLVKVSRIGGEGTFFLYFIKPGEACAISMVCALKSETSEIRAEAMEDSVLLQVPLALMDKLVQQYRSWYYFVLETYRRRFEELLEVIDNVTFRKLDERLEIYLKNKVRDLGTRELALTHQEIASDLNSSREVITRLLKKLEEKGQVDLGRNLVTWKGAE